MRLNKTNLHSHNLQQGLSVDVYKLYPMTLLYILTTVEY